MRSNRPYNLREHFSAVRKYLITKLSLVFINLFHPSKVTVVRDGGLGDAIMATAVIGALKNKYTNTEFYLSARFPEIFSGYKFKNHSFFSFPIIWLSYTHYDFFPWTFRKPFHCSQIMAELAGLRFESKMTPKLSLNENMNDEFMRKYVADKKYLIIQPSAGDWFTSKNWSVAQWEELVSRLKVKGKLVYQIGTSDNVLISGAIDLRGKLTIEQCLLLIKYASVLIGVNSFAEQASWVFQVPSVILYGPTNPTYSLNPGQIAVSSGDMIMYEDISELNYSFSKMESISCETVLKAIDQVT